MDIERYDHVDKSCKSLGENQRNTNTLGTLIKGQIHVLTTRTYAFSTHISTKCLKLAIVIAHRRSASVRPFTFLMFKL